MKRKLFYKIFAFTFGMMFLITVLAHVLIFVIAPSENTLITSATITNSDVYAFSEVDMPRLITQTILKSFPLSILCCTVISLFFSFLFSKGITTPILSISNSVHKMSRLEQTAKITVTRTDEIGILANDINALYQALLVTIRNLEEEKDKVHLAEKEKIDFLRTASHELKTPVTELNATLENMILKIGEYNDYELYLPRCKEITEQLAEMIKDILNASRLQTQSTMFSATTFSLANCITELCEPYRLIAATNGLQFETEIVKDISVHLPESQLKKAISNILSNAVNYTETGKSIKVSLDKSRLIIQNDCVPLSSNELQHIFEPFYRPDRVYTSANGGNGLGLYIVKTILDKLELQYHFKPMHFGNGMEFVIFF